MNDWKKLGWVAVASVAVFTLAGCERADAQSKKANVRPAAVAVASSTASRLRMRTMTTGRAVPSPRCMRHASSPAAEK